MLINTIMASPSVLLTLLFSHVGIQHGACKWAGNIVFRDEFQGDSLDLSKWEYNTGSSGYGEENLECYVGGRSNVQVRNGKLVITAKVQARDGKNYTSGRIRQKGPGFAYGAYVARARLPKGKHLWPAFWMFKETGGCKIEEIDIMEYRGQEVSTVELSAHYGKSWDALASRGVQRTVPFDLSADFHEFAVLWSNASLEYYVDNSKYAEYSLEPKEWRKGYNDPCGNEIKPFTERNNFVLNLAVGGSFFSELGDLTVDEAREWPKNTYEIDWVRVYQTKQV